MSRLHHIIKEVTEKCPYCSANLPEEYEEFSLGEHHYHVIVCQCKKRIYIKQQHFSSSLERTLN